MPLSAADLDRIEALAKGAASSASGTPEEVVAVGSFIAALDPDTVLALVEAARRGMAAPVVIAYCPPEPEPADDDD